MSPSCDALISILNSEGESDRCCFRAPLNSDVQGLKIQRFGSYLSLLLYNYIHKYTYRERTLGKNW